MDVTFTPRPLYPRDKCHRYLLDRRLGGPQSRSGCGDEGKYPITAQSRLIPGRLTRSLVTILADLREMPSFGKARKYRGTECMLNIYILQYF